MTITTQNQFHRTLEALAETIRLLANEMSYQPQHRKQEMVEFYNGHISKLEAAIDEYQAA